MITVLKLFGFLLLILVGYHYINEPIGFSMTGSIATGIFGLCLTTLYQGYTFEMGEIIGWLLIGLGCLLLSILDTFNTLIILVIIFIVYGYRMAGLPFNLPDGDGGGDVTGFDGGSCDGSDGGGDGGC